MPFGAATLSELAVLGKPSILVPLPPALGSSPQEANADMFGRKQAAHVIRDAGLKPEILVDRVKSIITSNTMLEAMAQAAQTFAKPGATQEIVDEVIKIANQRVASKHKQHSEGGSI